MKINIKMMSQYDFTEKKYNKSFMVHDGSGNVFIIMFVVVDRYQNHFIKMWSPLSPDPEYSWKG